MGNVLDFSGFCGQRHVSMLETGARSPLQKTRKLAMRWCVGEKNFTIEILITKAWGEARFPDKVNHISARLKTSAHE
jgi:hypothetical protein